MLATFCVVLKNFCKQHKKTAKHIHRNLSEFFNLQKKQTQKLEQKHDKKLARWKKVEEAQNHQNILATADKLIVNRHKQKNTF